MNRVIFYFLIFIFITIVSYFLTLFFKKLSWRFKVIDQPNQERKIHQQPMPLLGGWAIYLSFLIGVLIFIFFWPEKLLTIGISLKQIIGILIAGLVVMLSGTRDDLKNLKAGWQLIWIILAVLIIIFSGTTIKYISRPGGGIIDFTGPEINIFKQNIYLIGALLSLIWLLLTTNTTKLLDGIDGLASGVTLIGMVIIFIVSLFWDQPNSGTSILILIFAGSITGFLILNFYPAQIFLGNGGSNLLGLMLGVLAIISGAKIAAALLVMALPLLDMLWVIIQRLKKGESPWQHADRKHFHFRLLDLGFSQKKAVLIIYLISFVFGVIALFQETIGKIMTLGVLIVFVITIFYLVYKKNASNNYN